VGILDEGEDDEAGNGEMKSLGQIKKMRAKKEKDKMMNLSKDDRKKVISSIKKKAMERAVKKGFGKKGYQGKKGMSGKWKK